MSGTKLELDKVWEDDRLDRRKDADYLIQFLTHRIELHRETGQSASFVINIDSKWGGGKTFLLTRMRAHLAEQGYVSAYVNAWKDDHAGDPLIPLIASIETEMQKHYSALTNLESLFSAIKTNAKQLGVLGAKHSVLAAIDVVTLGAGGKAIRDTLDEFVELKADQAFEDFRKEKSLTESFRSSLLDLGRLICSGAMPEIWLRLDQAAF